MQRIALIVALFGCLQGCYTQQVIIDQVDISSDIQLPILSPESFDSHLLLTQSAEISYGTETRSLIFYSEFSAHKIVVAGLLPNGTRLFTISYDGNKLTTEGVAEVIEKIDPRYLLADLQFSLWPKNVIASEFQEKSACFIANLCALQMAEDGLSRKLYYKGQLIISAVYQSQKGYQDALEFNNFLRDYHLSITPLSIEVLKSEP